MGRPIKRICQVCHGGALALDVVAGLLFHAREGLRRHEAAAEEARNEEGQEPRDSCP